MKGETSKGKTSKGKNQHGGKPVNWKNNTGGNQ